MTVNDDDFFGIQQYEAAASYDPDDSDALKHNCSTKEVGTNFIEKQYFSDSSSEFAKTDHSRNSSNISVCEIEKRRNNYTDSETAVRMPSTSVPSNSESGFIEDCDEDGKLFLNELGSCNTNTSAKIELRTKGKILKSKKKIGELAFCIENEECIVGEGLDAILSRIPAVWKMSYEELLDFMSARVLHNDTLFFSGIFSDNFIAFDKPYSLPFASAPKNSLQFDRLLKKLKERFSPETQYLRVVKTLDKHVTGVLLFAKYEEAAYKKIVDMYRSGLMEQNYRAILSAIPHDDEATINIPLRKTVRVGDVMMRPVLPNQTAKDILYATTEYKVLADNRVSSHVRCIVKNGTCTDFVLLDCTHQIRSHFGLGIGCPILGEKKYLAKNPYWKQRINPQIMRYLDLTGNQHHRLPLYLHCQEVFIPFQSRFFPAVSIKAPIPEYFLYTLKKLRLLRK
uniref:Pseudouridylate synthase RPUSD4, mitochondrial n=1 Tax=Syphacia muris TaxID=451379 RepID=A0A158R4L4_9BILA